MRGMMRIFRIDFFGIKLVSISYMSSPRNANPEPNEQPDGVEPGSSYYAIMKLIKWADEIPEETWASVPKDASKQLKHYMYGSPKVPE
jgi:hypothetical protein